MAGTLTGYATNSIDEGDLSGQSNANEAHAVEPDRGLEPLLQRRVAPWLTDPLPAEIEYTSLGQT